MFGGLFEEVGGAFERIVLVEELAFFQIGFLPFDHFTGSERWIRLGGFASTSGSAESSGSKIRLGLDW